MSVLVLWFQRNVHLESDVLQFMISASLAATWIKQSNGVFSQTWKLHL
jgi:hypothetical protein